MKRVRRVQCVTRYNGIERAALRRQDYRLRAGFIIKICDTGSAVTFEAAESETPVIGHTFTNFSTLVIVHLLGNLLPEWNKTAR